jgi:glyoxylase-like metal-dependent hydrolase (beta-lactamase superfamily II)
MIRNCEALTHLTGSCSTYTITRQGASLAIDCGTWTPAALGETTDTRCERLLLTHFHRDQCTAAAQWMHAGVDVVIPFTEKRFFEEADILRASYDTYDNYTAWYPGFSGLQDITGIYARDYDTLSWRDISIEVLPLPGHTFGQSGYLFELDGTRYLACGDLLSAPGKIHEYHRLQWAYMSFQGHVNLLESLQSVRELAPDVILPGHGEPFAFSPAAIDELTAALAELFEMFHGRPYQPYRAVFRQLSDHVFEVSNSSATTYIVRDDEGRGLFIDCGYTSGAPISANPHRFIDHLTPRLEAETGITDVEWFLPSHYHDDHLAGLPTLQIKYGTKVACSAQLQDLLEHPERYDMPCTVPHATTVDHVIGRDELFCWRGFEFRMEQFPGQTWYHHLITFDADNRRYLSIGDNVSGISFRENRDFVHSFIPKNRTPVSSYSDMPRQILDRKPDMLLTGHGGAVDCKAEQIASWQGWMDRWTTLFEGIIDRPNADYGMDPQWVEFYPYKTRVRPGDELQYEIRVRNHDTVDKSGRLVLSGTPGVQFSTEAIDIAVAAGETAAFEVTARFPDSYQTHAWTLTVDVTWDGVRHGQIAEAIAWW